MVALSSICFQWSREEETDGRLADCLFRLSDLCGVVVYTDRVLLMVNRWSASSNPRKEHFSFRGPFGDCATVLKVKGYFPFHGWSAHFGWPYHILSRKFNDTCLKQGPKRMYEPNPNLLIIVQ